MDLLAPPLPPILPCHYLRLALFIIIRGEYAGMCELIQ